jgi:hypothetical protein
MRAEGFRGYQDLKLVDIPKPNLSDGRMLVRLTAAGVTPLEQTILSGEYPRGCTGSTTIPDRRQALRQDCIKDITTLETKRGRTASGIGPFIHTRVRLEEHT